MWSVWTLESILFAILLLFCVCVLFLSVPTTLRPTNLLFWNGSNQILHWKIKQFKQKCTYKFCEFYNKMFNFRIDCSDYIIMCIISK